MDGKTSGKRSFHSFEDGTGPGLETVGGEFQPQLETGYPGGGADLIFVLVDTRFHRGLPNPPTLS
jgi:hypothetical protein